MADFRGFQAVRTLRSRTFLVDNGSRERNALAAFRLASKRSIRLARGHAAIARRFADLSFADGIANADDHVCSLSLKER